MGIREREGRHYIIIFMIQCHNTMTEVVGGGRGGALIFFKNNGLCCSFIYLFVVC